MLIINFKTYSYHLFYTKFIGRKFAVKNICNLGYENVFELNDKFAKYYLHIRVNFMLT